MSQQRVIEIQGLLELSNNLLDAMGIIQPTGEARTLLAAALKKSRDLAAWIRCLQDHGTSVSPSWTEFMHSNGYYAKYKEDDASANDGE